VSAVFAYGTLEIPAVMEAVTGRRFSAREASVRGFARWRLRGQVFPAAVAEPGAVLAGRLYEGVDPATLARLDRFEGRAYERRTVPVQLAEGGERGAEIYLLAAGRRGELLAEPWDRAAFVAQHLGAYLESCAAFRTAYEARESGRSEAPRR
jgi:gamma-glutamylcyclotransferase (GGCT)/AIG2-like uncharacterized protein YtfP